MRSLRQSEFSVYTVYPLECAAAFCGTSSKSFRGGYLHVVRTRNFVMRASSRSLARSLAASFISTAPRPNGDKSQNHLDQLSLLIRFSPSAGDTPSLYAENFSLINASSI